MAKLKEMMHKNKDSGFYEESEEKMKFRAKDWWKYLVSIALLIIYLFPFYIIINVSLKAFSDTTSRIQFRKQFTGITITRLFKVEKFLQVLKTA